MHKHRFKLLDTVPYKLGNLPAIKLYSFVCKNRGCYYTNANPFYIANTLFWNPDNDKWS